MTPCPDREESALGEAGARISEHLECLLKRDDIDRFAVSVTLAETVRSDRLAEWGLFQAPDELLGSLSRDMVLSLAQRPEVQCIAPARELVSWAAQGEAGPSEPLRSRKFDAGVVESLATNPAGPRNVSVAFTSPVDPDWLSELGLRQSGRLPAGGLLATGSVDNDGLRELTFRDDVRTIRTIAYRHESQSDK